MLAAEVDILTSAERKILKARAHNLEPVVIIGGKGLTDEVVKEVDRALAAPEIIKVRAPGIDRDARESFQALCERTGAAPVRSSARYSCCTGRTMNKPKACSPRPSWASWCSGRDRDHRRRLH
jgi:putative YhbY family RNA-binding protein